MALTTTAEALERVTHIETRTKELRERMRRHYNLFTLAPFAIGKEEGEFENFTTNSPAVLGNKVIHLLSSARRRIFIPFENEEAKKIDRTMISASERCANGFIEQCDANNTKIPEKLPSQDEAAFYAAIRGLVIMRFIFVKDKDDEDLPVPKLALFDPLNTYWISGESGLIFVAHRRYDTIESVDDEYNVKVTGDNNGIVSVWDVWDKDDEGIIVGDHTEWIDKQSHTLGHIPIGIFAAGSVPIVHDNKRNDTIKNWAQSVYVNNEGIYTTDSRLLSYALTRAGQSAKMPKVITYDSDKGALPPELETDPDVKGNIIFLDTAKGQNMEDFIQLPSGETIRDIQMEVSQQLSIGGMSPVSFGYIDKQLPASGIIALIRASLERVFPAKKAMENAYKWLAQEIITQYKEGEWKEVDLEGKDHKNKIFRTTIKPDDVSTKWNFDCELALESIQAELEMAGIISQLVKDSIISMQTAREHFPWITDPDAEQDTIDREKIYNILGIQMRKTAGAALKDGDIEAFTMIMQDLQTQTMGAGGQPAAGMPGAPNPAMLVGRRMAPPSPEDARLRQLGLARGR